MAIFNLKKKPQNTVEASTGEGTDVRREYDVEFVDDDKNEETTDAFVNEQITFDDDSDEDTVVAETGTAAEDAAAAKEFSDSTVDDDMGDNRTETGDGQTDTPSAEENTADIDGSVEEPLDNADTIDNNGTAITDDDIDAPADDTVPIEEYERVVGELTQLGKRHEMLQADWANYKKRSATELAEEKERACADLAVDMFPVFDDLERAITHARSTGNADIADGMMAVYKKGIGAFAKRGIQRLYPQGETFDAETHMAVQKSDADEAGVEPDTIVKVLQCGYEMAGRVLRPAMVVVAV